MSYVNLHPFGMNPSEEDLARAAVEVAKVYEDCPETTCCSKAECCNAGCPNMYYSEFIAMRRGAVDKMSREQRLELTVECVKRYLQDQRTPKPCVFLQKDNKCGIYDHRHLKCRTYGLIPATLYDWIAKSVSMEMNIPINEVPLCNQCQDVKIKPEFAKKYPNNQILTATIQKMEKRMKEIDRTYMGMKEKTQEDGVGFLTYHDWHLLYEFGPEWLVNMTKLRLNLKDEEKKQFVESLRAALEAKGVAKELSEEQKLAERNKNHPIVYEEKIQFDEYRSVSMFKRKGEDWICSECDMAPNGGEGTISISAAIALIELNGKDASKVKAFIDEEAKNGK